LLRRAAHAIIKTGRITVKKTLHDSLVDYDMALLRALAEVRGAVLTSNRRLTAADELEAQLATPASLAIALADLSEAETEALAALQAADGWMEAPRFARRFGPIRRMGPGRLEREQAWLSPANPAEGLWYRALIFTGFRQTEGGVVKVVYIPDDVLQSLPDLSPEEPLASETARGLAMEPLPPPARISPAVGDVVVEDVFGVLVAVRNRDIRPKPDGSLAPKDLQAINALCVSPLPAANVAGDDRLGFILHLPRAAGLVTVGEGRLALNPDPARAWLAASPAQRLSALQRAWRDDEGWNDLWRVPSLKPQPTGWKNNPIMARRQVLDSLSGCHPGDWYGLADLISAVKEAAPDFQRPDGDYTAWYIHDLGGQPLMGFEHWDAVEGALLRYLISGPLHWLGAVDLGSGAASGQPTAFRLAETGLAFLGLAPLPEEEPARGPASPDLVVGEDFTVRVPVDISLYTRFQLARFGDFLGREADGVRYRLSPQGLARAQGGGITPDQIIAFLIRASGDRAPANVLDDVQRWGQRSGSVRLEPGVVLRVDRPETLGALRREPAIARLLGEALGPQAVLVPRANVKQVRRWLLEQGYLEK
jgi:hypothetical protein